MKKIFILSCFAVFSASVILVSCNNQESPQPNQTVTEKFTVSESMLPFTISGGKTKSKNSGARTNATLGDFVGPFPVNSTNTKLNGQSNGLWKNVISGWGYSYGIYFCEVYAHRATITIPPGGYNFTLLSASNYGFPGNPNPIDPVTNTPSVAITTTQGPSGTTVYLDTYTVFPKFNTSGQSININGRIPSNFTSTVFVYRYEVN